MKIKKVISLALVFCMLCSFMGAQPGIVYAAEDVTLALYNDSDTSKLASPGNDYGKATISEGGANGKGDKYVILDKDTSSTTTGRLELRYSKIATDEPNYASYKYLVMSVQVMPYDSTFTDIIWTTNGSQSLSQPVTALDNSAVSSLMGKINVGKWNQYTTVYDLLNDVKVAYTYVNGELVDTNTESETKADIPLSDITTIRERLEQAPRIQLQMYCPGDSQIGIDDLHIYLTDTAPAFTQPALSAGTGYTIDESANTITVEKGTLVSALASNGTVTVWNDTSYSATVDDTSKLSAGNVVVVSSAGGFAYYDVLVNSTPKTLALYNDSNTSSLVPADGNAYGFPTVTQASSGKTQAYVTLAKDLTTDKGDVGRMELRKTKFDESGYADYRYLVMSAQLMPLDSGFTAIRWHTNSNQSISQPIDNDGDILAKFNVGKWNEYTTVYDLSGDIKKAYTYVNGELVNTNIEDDGKIAPLRDISTVGSSTRIQLQMFGAVDCKMGADDIHIYLTDNAPLFTQPTLTSVDGKYTVNNDTNTVSVQKGTLVSDLVSSGTATVWGDNTYSSAVADTAQLSKGNVIVVNTAGGSSTSAAGGFKYYNVEVAPLTLGFLSDEKNEDVVLIDSHAGTFGVYEETKASNGKPDSYLTMQKIAQNSSGVWEKRLEFRYNAFEADAPNYADYKYLVMSAQVMPLDDGFTDIIWTTNGTQSISQPITKIDNTQVSSLMGKINVGKWNKITTVYDLSNDVKVAYTYVNGELFNTNSESGGTLKDFVDVCNSENARIQLQMFCPGEERMGVDNINIYLTDDYPEISQPVTITNEQNDYLTISNNVLTTYKKMTPADITLSGDATMTVFDTPTYDYELLSTNPMYNGNVIVLRTADDIYTYYDVVFYNANVPAVNSTDGTATATAYLMDSVMILACYDQFGDLADVDVAYTTDGNGQKTLTLTESEEGEYTKVKAFVWNNLTSMTPISYAEWTNNPTIACWGASLTRGQGASDESVNSYPAVLQTLSGLNVYNMGVGGETVMTVAARQGSLDILLEESVTIPASGSVNIKFKASNGGIVTPREVNRGMWNPCSINGVEGTLSVVVDTEAWPRVLKSATFTRTTAGNAVECPAGTELVVAAQSISPMADINIIELGSNGAWTTENLALEAHTTDAQRNSLAQMGVLMAQNCKNPEKTYIISLSSMSKSDRAPLDTILKNQFGDRYIDVGSYLQSEQALTDAGITPTDLDKEYIAAGKVPPSLLNDKEDIENGVSGADVTHLNDAGYRVKAQYIFERLKALGAF